MCLGCVAGFANLPMPLDRSLIGYFLMAHLTCDLLLYYGNKNFDVTGE
jgi:hypothetical protein